MLLAWLRGLKCCRCLEVHHVLLLVVKHPQHLLLMIILPLNPFDAAGRRSVFNLVLFAFLHAALEICPMVYMLVSGIDCSSQQFLLYSFRLLVRSHTELTWIDTKAC